MKRLFIYLAALAALISCSRETNDIQEPATKLIPYRAEVTGDDTKASLNGSTKYIFEAGDRLYVSYTSGSDVKMHGFLTMISGAGSTKAVFEGNLVCDDDFSPADDTPVDVVLVGPSDLMHEAVTGGLLSEAAAYPDDVYASSLADAVEHYSNFTCSGLYGDGAFVLSQQSTFLRFSIKIKKTLAPIGSTFTAKIYNNTGADLLRSATVTAADNTTTTTKVEFVAIFPGGSTSLTNASVELVEVSSGNTLKEWNINDATLARNNYYNISRAYKTYDGFRIIARGAGTITRTGSTTKLYYSTDYGETWQQYTSGFSVEAGDEVCFRSTETEWNKNKIRSSGQFDVAGDIASLLLGASFPDGSLPGSYSFTDFFNGCTTLIDASGLVLSMKTLPAQAYKSFFDSCTNLIAGPEELAATSLNDRCYRNMFWNCTSLTSAPIIRKATTHNSSGWYQQMFRNCSSLQEIVFLDVSNYDSTNFTDWVNGINASGTFHKNSLMTFPPTPGVSAIPSGWTVVDDL